METFFWSNKSNGTINTENSFALQNELHKAKLSFSLVLKHFPEIDKTLLFKVKKESTSDTG